MANLKVKLEENLYNKNIKRNIIRKEMHKTTHSFNIDIPFPVCQKYTNTKIKN